MSDSYSEALMAERTSVSKALDQQEKADAAKKAAIEEIRQEIIALANELKKLGVSIAEVPFPWNKAKASVASVGRVCSNCGQPGHNARTCPQKKGK